MSAKIVNLSMKNWGSRGLGHLIFDLNVVIFVMLSKIGSPDTKYSEVIGINYQMMNIGHLV